MRCLVSWRVGWSGNLGRRIHQKLYQAALKARQTHWLGARSRYLLQFTCYFCAQHVTGPQFLKNYSICWYYLNIYCYEKKVTKNSWSKIKKVLLCVTRGNTITSETKVTLKKEIANEKVIFSTRRFTLSRSSICTLDCADTGISTILKNCWCS